MRGLLGIAGAGVEVAEVLERVEIGRIGPVDFEIGLDGVIEFVLLDALFRPGLEFFQVNRHRAVPGVRTYGEVRSRHHPNR